METEAIITWAWFGAGVLLMLLELAAPGLVVVFLGGAAIIVAVLRWLGLVFGMGTTVAIWMALSIVLVLALRNVLQRFVPSEARRDESDEASNAIGQVVEVVRDCDADTTRGRIRWQGTTWSAQTVDGVVEAGTRARLVYRDNLAWIIEPHDAQAAQIEAIEAELYEPAEVREPAVVEAKRS